MLFFDTNEQSSNMMSNIFNDVHESLQQDTLQCEMENDSSLIADAQLHLADQLWHQDFNRRYER